MKPASMTVWACLFFFAAGACTAFSSEPKELRLEVVLTTGERSKDSSSQTTTITVERTTIVWEQTFGGHRGRQTAPTKKEFKLLPGDKERLVQLIQATHLLVTDAIELPQGSPSRYFSLSVSLTLDKKSGVITISGPRNAVTVMETPLYQDSLALVKALYRILNRQDKSLVLEELVR